MDFPNSAKDPKTKLFIRLTRDGFKSGDEDEVKQLLTDLLGETPLKDYKPNIAKGYCFLHFESRVLTAEAHDNLMNKTIRGHTLRPFFGFTPMEQRAVDAGVKDTEIEQNMRTICVKNVPQTCTQEELSELLSGFGEIAKCSIVPTKSSSIAFVLFRKFKPAQMAVEEHGAAGIDIRGTNCSVEASKNKNIQKRVERFMKQPFGMYDGYGPPRGGFRGRGRGGCGGRGRGGFGGPPRGGFGGGYGRGGFRGGFGGPRGGYGGGFGGNRGGGFGGRGGYGGNRGGGYGGNRGGGYGGNRGGGFGGGNNGGQESTPSFSGPSRGGFQGSGRGGNSGQNNGGPPPNNNGGGNGYQPYGGAPNTYSQPPQGGGQNPNTNNQPYGRNNYQQGAQSGAYGGAYGGANQRPNYSQNYSPY